MPVKYEISPLSELDCIDTGSYVTMLAFYAKSSAPKAQLLTAGESADKLMPKTALGEGESLKSADGSLRLTMESNGNVVLYATVNNQVLYETKTYQW